MKKSISEKHEYPHYLSPQEIISQGYQLSGDALELFALSSVNGLSEKISAAYIDAVNNAKDEVDQMELF